MLSRSYWTALAGPLLFVLVATDAVSRDADLVPTDAAIIANLKLHYPQLTNAEVQIGEYVATGIDGLRLGQIMAGDQQAQAFLIGSNGTIYLLAGEPIEVLPAASIETRLEERRLAERDALVEQQKQLTNAMNLVPLKGNPDADHVIVEFSDFQCPYCADATDTIRDLIDQHGDKVKYALLDFPLDDIHPWARNASIAALCAANQNDASYWVLHDFYFEHQESITENSLLADSRQQLASDGFDLEEWEECAGDASSSSHQAAADKVAQAAALGESLGVDSTPTFFFNGEQLAVSPTIAQFEALIAGAQSDSAAHGSSP